MSHEVREAKLDKVWMQWHLTRLLVLHRARLRGDLHHPMVGLAADILAAELRNLADPRPCVGTEPGEPPLRRRGLGVLSRRRCVSEGRTKDRQRLVVCEALPAPSGLLAELDRHTVGRIAWKLVVAG